MLTEVCQYLRNWFTRAQCYGHFKIENGELQTQYDTGVSFSAVNVVPGQHFRIIGSALNDGVYQYPYNQLSDEEFDGAVWVMSVPPVILAICDEITEWQAKYSTADSAALSPYTSESFGGYSYTKGRAAADGSDNGVTWKNVFGARLAPWRKI